MDNTLPDQQTSNDPAQPKLRWIRLAFDLVLLWSFISAISIPLQLDNWPPAVFLAYPPRAPYILLAAGFAAYLLLTRILLRQIKRGYWLRLGMSLTTIICCIYSLGWNPLRTPPAIADATSKFSISLVTANTGGHPVEFADQLAKLRLPEVICLQEVSVSHRKKIAARFPNHQYVTGYRTFAVIAPLRSGSSKSLAIVNVHTTKALAFHAGLQGFISKTPRKSYQHVDERIAIESWAKKQPNNLGILLAGDFNAPTRTVGVRFNEFANSHLTATNSSLLTFPESWPVLGIDHVFGNGRIHFTKSEVLRNSFSDHRYRRVEFSFPDL